MHKARSVMAVAWLASSLLAQFPLTVETEARRVTRAIWQGVSGEQRIAIDFGQPKWRTQHERFITDGTSGTVMLGRGGLTTLRTDVELSFGAQKLAPGRYYLSLRRTARDTWFLAVFDADKADASRRGTSAVFVLDPKLSIPTALTREDAIVEDFEMALSGERSGPEKLTLGMRWGPFRMAVGFTAAFDRRRPEGMPDFGLTPEGQGTKTASGLIYQPLQAGSGASPLPTDTVTVQYTGWLTDGTMFDSSYLREKPAEFNLKSVVPGFAEGIQLMAPGATYRLTIPPTLAYGERGVPPTVPPNATLVFTVTLVSVAGR